MRLDRARKAFGILAAAASLFAAAGAARAQAPDSKISPILTEEVQKSGAAVAIIRLNAPEADAAAMIKAGERPYEAAQKRLASDLKGAGVTTRYEFQIAPFIVAETNAAGLKALADHPLVESVEADVPVAGSAVESAQVIQADQVIDNLGYTGAGVAIAVIDTGVDMTVPLIANSVVAQQKFLNQGTLTGPSAIDDNGHGTAVAALLTSDDPSLRGIAPDSSLVVIKALDGTNAGYMSDIARGVEWAGLQQSSIPGLSLINISAGDPQGSPLCPCDTQSGYGLISSVVKAVTASGMTVVAASGNMGFTDRIAAPACLENVIAVGATYDAVFAAAPSSGRYSDQPLGRGDGFSACSDNNTDPDRMACFTNRNACLDFLAPGYALTTTQMGGLPGMRWGTSMAAPQVTATLALMRQKAGRATAPFLLILNLSLTADAVVDPYTLDQRSRINALNAVNATAPGPQPDFIVRDPGDVIVGDHEDGNSRNKFVFPDAFDLRHLAEYGPVAPQDFVWSYTALDVMYAINGVSPLQATDTPLTPPAARTISSNDLDSGNLGQDNTPFTVTFRNSALSPTGFVIWPNPPGGLTGIMPNYTRTVTLHASTLTTYSSRSIVLYSANDTSDRLSATLLTLEQDDFVNNPSDRSGWVGGVLAGSGSYGSASGLCMSVPLLGDNIIAWISPETYIPLADSAVYRIRATADGTQLGLNAIPLWNLIYNNYYTTAPGQGNLYSGESWFLDVEGGANGVGRSRTTFEIWATPNAALTDQWRGVIDAANSAFTPQADIYNDMRVVLRVLDLGSAPLNSNIDAGTICLQRILIQSAPISALPVVPVWNPPIQNNTHEPEATGQGALGTTAFIDDPTATAVYLLAANGVGSRKTLFPWDSQDPTASFYKQFYPVTWESDTVYLGRTRIRSNLTGGAEGTDPLDAIILGFDATTSELGQLHATIIGSPGNMYRAASPRSAASTGGVAQEYVAFFHSHSATNSVQPDAVAFRMFVDLFNTPVIIGTTNGRDPLAIESLEIHKVTAGGIQ